MSTILEVSDLHVEYESVGQVNRGVNGVSFRAEAGEIVGIVGESGSGKSTAVLALLGLTRSGGRITSGSVRFRDRELLGLSEREWREVRGGEIALVPQNPRGALNPVLRVGAQLVAAYRAHCEATPEQARQRALELLRAVGINDPERRFEAWPHELSGGMAQRIVIAMALACEPTLLVADEPTSGLDVTVQAQVLNDLHRAARSVGSALLIITQDLGIVANYCDRVYVMHAGEIVESAGVAELFAAPAHPSTVALLLAQRKVRDRALQLHGLPVDGRSLPSGCYLSPRCPFAADAAGCFATHPELAVVGEGHEVRCHRRDAVRDALLRAGADAAPVELLERS